MFAQGRAALDSALYGDNFILDLHYFHHSPPTPVASIVSIMKKHIQKDSSNDYPSVKLFCIQPTVWL